MILILMFYNSEFFHPFKIASFLLINVKTKNAFKFNDLLAALPLETFFFFGGGGLVNFY